MSSFIKPVQMNFLLHDVAMEVDPDLDLLRRHFLHHDQVVLVLTNEILLALMVQKMRHLSKTSIIIKINLKQRHTYLSNSSSNSG
jgi:hypothetical protein